MVERVANDIIGGGIKIDSTGDGVASYVALEVTVEPKLGYIIRCSEITFKNNKRSHALVRNASSAFFRNTGLVLLKTSCVLARIFYSTVLYCTKTKRNICKRIYGCNVNFQPWFTSRFFFLPSQVIVIIRKIIFTVSPCLCFASFPTALVYLWWSTL